MEFLFSILYASPAIPSVLCYVISFSASIKSVSSRAFNDFPPSFLRALFITKIGVITGEMSAAHETHQFCQLVSFAFSPGLSISFRTSGGSAGTPRLLLQPSQSPQGETRNLTLIKLFDAKKCKMENFYF